MIGKLKTVFHTLQGSLSGASREHYQNRELDQNRAEGDRPYKSLSNEEVKSQYVSAIGTVRDADEGGMHLSSTIDRGWNLSKEWEARGNDKEELDAALQEAGYEVDD